MNEVCEIYNNKNEKDGTNRLLILYETREKYNTIRYTWRGDIQTNAI